MGTIDKVIRILVALVVVVLYYTHYFRHTGDNFIAFCRSFYSYKFPEFLSAIPSFWIKYQKERIKNLPLSR